MAASKIVPIVSTSFPSLLYRRNLRVVLCKESVDLRQSLLQHLRFTYVPNPYEPVPLVFFSKALVSGSDKYPCLSLEGLAELDIVNRLPVSGEAHKCRRTSSGPYPRANCGMFIEEVSKDLQVRLG
jgi:hypothetical protein